MAKSSKRKKEKQADFTKAKLKLGKGKKLASNAVDTSFKVRSIALPKQSISDRKSDIEPATRRKATLNTLLSHLHHHNTTTRKDAITGLRGLLEDSPGLMTLSLSTIIAACVRLIADEEATVRKTMLSFMGWFLPQISSIDLMPHTPLMLLFITSAQTHIFPSVRIDGIRFVDVLLDIVPLAVLDGWNGDSLDHSVGRSVLAGYLGLLATSKENTRELPADALTMSSVTLSAESRLLVLQSFCKFLRLALSMEDRHNRVSTQLPMPIWCFPPYFKEKPLVQQILSAHLQTSSKDTSITHHPILDSITQPFFALDDLRKPDLAAASELLPEAPNNSRRLKHLCTLIQPMITSTFLDCAPSIFPTGNMLDSIPGKLISAVMELAHTLYTSVFQDAHLVDATVSDALATFLSHVAPYFPFDTYLHSESISLQNLNLKVCDMMSSLTLASCRAGLQLPRSLPAMEERAREHVLACVQGEGQQLGRHLTATSYVSLLPTYWALLNNPNNDMEIVYQSLVDHAIRTTPNSAIKTHSIKFVGGLLVIFSGSEYAGPFTLKSSTLLKAQELVLHLPRVLWEIDQNDTTLSEWIVQLLLGLVQRRSAIIDDQVSSALQDRFVPYFVISHPVHGEVHGPFSRLTIGSRLRRLVMNLLATLLRYAVKPSEALLKATENAIYGTSDEVYWNHIWSSWD